MPFQTPIRILCGRLLLTLIGGFFGCGANKELVIKEANFVQKIWPDAPPNFEQSNREPADLTKKSDPLIAGRTIIRMGHVNIPEIHVFVPPEENRTRTAVVVCPGGGFNILAWDLEGTEVAEWLNSFGVTAVVLKYRVPTRNNKPMWQAGVEDAQRTVGLVRAAADRWNLDSDKIGILGFSAGGCIAARTSCTAERLYSPVDEADQHSCRPNFSILIYPAMIASKDKKRIGDGIVVNAQTPPAFLAHATDDHVPVENSQIYHEALVNVGVASELYVCELGGHGFGLRPDEQKAITDWPERCKDWLIRHDWLSQNDTD